MTRFKVVGPHKVAGIAPGEVGEADFPPSKVARLQAGGHIQLVVVDTPPPDIEEQTQWAS